MTDIRVSPSQISTFRECPSKWAFRHLDKIPAPQTSSAARGEECHGHWERYLRDSTPIPGDTETGRIAQELVQWLPPPRTPGILVEEPLHIDAPGWSCIGRVDWVVPAEGYVVVGDHKTTSNLRYAKSATDLATDPQGVLYAAWAMVRFRVREVRLAWNYVQTRGRRDTLPIRATMTHETVDTALVGIVETINAMRATTSSETAETRDACSLYGGCPYRDRCSGAATPSLF